MLLVSFLLVIVATIFLLSGLFFTKDLPLIFISIAFSALAGLVLIVAVLRSRPRPSTAQPVGGPGPEPVEVPAAAAARQPGGRPERDFPIADYETLEVVEVLPLLGELEAADLEQVRQREASGRAHPWVLARIDALLESEAETGELEWSTGGGAARDAEPADEWAAPEEGWAGARSSTTDWAASDFELESEAGYEEAEEREFPIANYDELRANEVLPILTTLAADDLELVRQEEAAGKARTSILSRIDVLLGRSGAPPPRQPLARPAPARAAAKAPARPSKAAQNLPIENYDALTVGQIAANLAGLSIAELRQIRTYEKRHKARAGVLQRIESAIARGR